MKVSSKKCSRCLKMKPLGDFSKRAIAKDGLHYYCRPCHRSSVGAWRKKNVSGWKKIMRKHYLKHRDQIIKESARWRRENREKSRLITRKASAKWKKNNPEEAKAWRKENLERVKASRRRLYALKKDHYRELYKRWRATPKGKLQNAKNHAIRRAKFRIVVCNFTLKEWYDMKEAQSGRCAYCGKTAVLTIDHKTPISRGGQHTKENIHAVCQPCNSSKNARTHEEYLTILKERQ